MSGLSPARLLVLAVVCVALGCSRDNPDYFDDPGGVVGPPAGGRAGGAPADAVVEVAVDSEPVDSGAAVVDGAPVDAGVDRGVMGDAGGDAGVVDEDGDGVPAGLDCDDGDGAVFPGAVERCDGRDEDCDEAVDEGVAGCCVAGAVQVCGRDVGACRAGAQRCGDDGAFGACAGAVGPGVEGCDGVDEDCDGVVDEGFGVGAACVVGEGACAVMGVVVCGRAAVCDAAPGAPGVERCDGVDEDCDGAVDEGFRVGRVCLAGEGVCAREGVVGCMDGEAVCDAVPGEPGVELCNGLDEDCDGVTDEGAGGGMACDAGRGACRRSGQVVCDDRGERICDVVAGPPGVERCNRIDDDCDGPTDEDWPTLGQRCVVEAGGCASRGVFACAADGAGVFCDAAPIAGVDERCNGGDDDCDGRVDEGIGLGEACEAGVGRARGPGCGCAGRRGGGVRRGAGSGGGGDVRWGGRGLRWGGGRGLRAGRGVRGGGGGVRARWGAGLPRRRGGL
ncbi:MAG: putative metal-binding motif-containing protein [Myxococcales bacterium]|nr:putative metal-binding motif-containing protein [Myxococcales bacterium]